MRTLVRSFSLVLVILVSAVAAFSQTPTGSIKGRVLDPNGAAVVNGTVTIKEAATNRGVVSANVIDRQPDRDLVDIRETRFVEIALALAERRIQRPAW